jgi:hypothetical protein
MTTQTRANPEMVEGYLDGLDAASPEPSENRSRSYRHGFANGRDDLARKPRDCASNLIQQAQEAMTEDANA